MVWAEPNAGDRSASAKAGAGGQHAQSGKKDKARHQAAAIPDAKQRPVRTKHTVMISGQHVSYVAETGMLPLLNSDGTSRASVFFVAYIKQDGKSADQRPVTFCFNGGPGSSSVWLHLARWGRGA